MQTDSIEMCFLFGFDRKCGNNDDDEEDNTMLYCFPNNQEKSPFKGICLTAHGLLDSLCGEKAWSVKLSRHNETFRIVFAHKKSITLAIVIKDANSSECFLRSLAFSILNCLEFIVGHLVSEKLADPKMKTPLNRVFAAITHLTYEPGWSVRLWPDLTFRRASLAMPLPPPLLTAIQNVLSQATDSPSSSSPPFRFVRRIHALFFRNVLLYTTLSQPLTTLCHRLCLFLGLFSDPKIEESNSGTSFNPETKPNSTVFTHVVHLPPSNNISHHDLHHHQFSNESEIGQSNESSNCSSTPSHINSPYLNDNTSNNNNQYDYCNENKGVLAIGAVGHFVLVQILESFNEDLNPSASMVVEGMHAAGMVGDLFGTLSTPLHEIFKRESVAYGIICGFYDDAPYANRANVAVKTKVERKTPSEMEFFMKREGDEARPRNSERNPSPNPNPSLNLAEASGAPVASSNTASRTTTEQKPLGTPCNLDDSSVRHNPGTNKDDSFKPDFLSSEVEPSKSSEFNFPSSLAEPSVPLPHSFVPSSSLLPPSSSSTSPLSDTQLFPALPSPALPSPALPSPPLPSSYLPSPPPKARLLLLYDPSAATVQILGDIPPPLSLASIWGSFDDCLRRLEKQTAAVAAPPNNSRLSMALNQIARSAVAEGRRTGGSLLGSADSAPWQYHPELASLSAVQYVTTRLYDNSSDGGFINNDNSKLDSQLRCSKKYDNSDKDLFCSGIMLRNGRIILQIHDADLDFFDLFMEIGKQ